jgi:Zn-dependent protease with chaperone function
VSLVDMSQKCPQCGEQMPAPPNFTAWCPACEWGMAKPAPERKGILRARADRWSARRVEALFQQVSGSRVHRPGWDLARLASYALAICVHVAFLALIGLAIWLIAGITNIVTIVLGLFALLVAFELRPRLGSFRKLANVRRREDAPVLFGLLDQVAAETGAKRAHAVVIDADWNAAYTTVGWRRRRVVILGLPLWDALPADQKVAVLGHEFAHGVNGDARRGVVVGTSIETLSRLYVLLQPGPRLHRSKGRTALAEAVASVVMAALRSVVAGVLIMQRLISLRASQRAEYLADDIAARVASPASMAGALDTIVTGRSTHAWVLERRRFNVGKTAFWDQMRSALSAIPPSEKELRRREHARGRLRVTDTHPPAHLRVKLLQGLPASKALISLSETQEEAIRAELAQDYDRISTVIDDAARYW